VTAVSLGFPFHIFSGVNRRHLSAEQFMKVSVSIRGMVAGAVLGAAIRFGVTYSQTYHSGWFWWYNFGLQATPGTAGFAGFVDRDIFISNYQNAGFCLVVSLLPGLIGGLIGAFSGAARNPLVGATIGGVLSGLAALLARLPELYRPGWFGKLWFDYNLHLIYESVIVGAIVGGLASGIARLSYRLLPRRDQPLVVEPEANISSK
jgi:hypothetical protein